MINLVFFHKVWQLLSLEYRRRFLWITGLMLVGAGLEMLGIGLMLPLLASMTQPELVTQSELLAPLLDLLGRPEQAVLVILAMLAFIGVNILRLAFLVLLAWLQSKYIKQLVIDISERLYVGYLAQPYTFHIQRNTAQLIRNTTGEVAVTASTIQNTMGLLSEAMVVVALSLFLMLVDPVGIIVVMLLMGSAAWLFYRFTHRRITNWGKQRQHHEGMRIQQLQQGLGGVKEIKLLGLEQFIIDEYKPFNFGSANANQRNTFVQALPRLWLELLVISGMGLYVILALLQGNAVNSLVPTLGLFGAAAFRLIPSVNRILGAVQGIRYGEPAVTNLRDELAQLDRSAQELSPKSDLEPLCDEIVVRNLSYSYPGSEQLALNQVSVRVPQGSAVGFVGDSGAGKSTLIDIILGLLEPSSGAVCVGNVDIADYRRAWQSQIGYVPQSIYLTDDSLRRNIAFGLPSEKIDEIAVERAVRLAQLEGLIDELPDGLDTIVGEHGVRLSGGQRQRIGIARALYYDPPVLVLDEATSALDNTTEHEFMKGINALHGHKTLLIIAHRLSTVAQCDLIYRLEKGRVVESGAADKILHNVSLSTQQKQAHG